MNEHEKINYRGAQTIIGELSGGKITIPNVNVPPMPALAPPGVVHNGKKAENFGEIDSSDQPPMIGPPVCSCKNPPGIHIGFRTGRRNETQTRRKQHSKP